MSRERIKRPEPERTHPVRNWSTVFGAPSRTTPPGVHAAADGRAAANDPVSRGVEAGYRVVDEYLRQGQNVARAMWGPFMPGGGAMPFPGWAGGASGNSFPQPEEVQQRMGAMLRSATDLAMMWMDFMSGGLGMGGFAPHAGSYPPGSHGPFPTNSERGAPPAKPPEHAREDRPQTVIAVELKSSRRAEVSVDLRSGSAGLALVVHDLRGPEPDRARLGGIGIQGFPAEDRVLVRIDVPDELPAGVYTGIIVDVESSLPRGTLAVRVAAE
jgi:hypothetical protein